MSSAQEIAEEHETLENRKDLSRPFFNRPPGQMGICMDAYTAEPEDKSRFGSQLYFLRHLMDLLYTEWSKTQLTDVKAAFESHDLLDGVIFEGYSKGVILAVSFDNMEALERLWRLHEDEKLAPILNEIFMRPEVLKKVGARSIDFRVRLFDDEYEDSKVDVLEKNFNKFILDDRECEQQLLREAREYQRTVLLSEILKIKDDLLRLDQNFGELIITYKKHLPSKIERVQTVEEMKSHADVFRSRKGEKKMNVRGFDDYFLLLDDLRELIREFFENICVPLSQVHACCESQKQTISKRKIRKLLKETLVKLECDYNLQLVKHREWLNKFVLNEQRLFGGIISLPPAAVQAVVDADIALDDYFSGFDIKL